MSRVGATIDADTVSTVVNKKRSSGITTTNGKIINLLGFTPRAYKLYNTRVYPSILYEDIGNNVEHVTVCCFTPKCKRHARIARAADKTVFGMM